MLYSLASRQYWMHNWLWQKNTQHCIPIWDDKTVFSQPHLHILDIKQLMSTTCYTCMPSSFTDTESHTGGLAYSPKNIHSICLRSIPRTPVWIQLQAPLVCGLEFSRSSMSANPHHDNAATWHHWILSNKSSNVLSWYSQLTGIVFLVYFL